MSVIAAVMPAPRVPVELREFPDPALEPGSLLLRTLYSDVCGTDVHVWHGRLAGVPYPIIPGHVSVGVADKIRGDVRGVDGTRVAEGEVSHFVRALRMLLRHHTAIPWRAVGARAYTLSELHQALADAEAMRLPKALVKPN